MSSNIRKIGANHGVDHTIVKTAESDLAVIQKTAAGAETRIAAEAGAIETEKGEAEAEILPAKTAIGTGATAGIGEEEEAQGRVHDLTATTTADAVIVAETSVGAMTDGDLAAGLTIAETSTVVADEARPKTMLKATALPTAIVIKKSEVVAGAGSEDAVADAMTKLRVRKKAGTTTIWRTTKSLKGASA